MVNIGSSTNRIPLDVLKQYSDEERFENVFHSYIGWVADARRELQGMDKIEIFNPILDKLSRGMYGATKDLYGSEKELSFSEIYDMKEALNLAASTFYRNRYLDLDYIGNDLKDYIGNDLKSEKISGLEGADILADAFEGFKSLENEEKQKIQNLADSVLRGIYEATKCLYDSDKSYKDEYKDTLENTANVFGSAMIKKGE